MSKDHSKLVTDDSPAFESAVHVEETSNAQEQNLGWRWNIVHSGRELRLEMPRNRPRVGIDLLVFVINLLINVLFLYKKIIRLSSGSLASGWVAEPGKEFSVGGKDIEVY